MDLARLPIGRRPGRRHISFLWQSGSRSTPPLVQPVGEITRRGASTCPKSPDSRHLRSRLTTSTVLSRRSSGRGWTSPKAAAPTGRCHAWGFRLREVPRRPPLPLAMAARPGNNRGRLDPGGARNQRRTEIWGRGPKCPEHSGGPAWPGGVFDNWRQRFEHLSDRGSAADPQRTKAGTNCAPARLWAWPAPYREERPMQSRLSSKRNRRCSLVLLGLSLHRAGWDLPHNRRTES